MEKIIEDIVPTKFELAQNYPNPFSRKTTIKFCIPDRMKIRLEIYNTDNRKIKTLIDEIKEAGTYEIDFSASKLLSSVSAKGGYTSGVYFYQLKAGSFVETKKMVLIK